MNMSWPKEYSQEQWINRIINRDTDFIMKPIYLYQVDFDQEQFD